ncbi:toxin RelE [Longimycelium tulufanense]|uniref:Toxin RelE n=1 Tax=Longimycelium tulufanense TaxID=907463 RepID=A0A8J3CKP7_9PSEU|nr:type II toxin-antitoxin system RelE/ParE family toxin [Longimycelium tulufanense]GGM84583.1 toxin RelE [Longimycelium tulufanense]
MSHPVPYAVTFTAAARRGLDKLPYPAAVALYEHLTGPVAGNPYRLGKPLNAPLDGVWSTRRGDYRALYTIDDDTHSLTVVAVAHRRDAYRTR